ncbi:MAG TPA: signal peptidase II [Actinomycetota bacterium]|nr:signal peptidase II [Actinomycetota bacterium]
MSDRPLPTGVYPRLLGAAAVVLALDQITKTLALEALSDEPIDIIEGAVTLELSYNSGGVFGVGRGFPGVFLAATIIVTLGILLWARRIEERTWLVPLGMVLGGGLGNLADRVFRGHDGQVVDFIDLHVWPVFTLADTSIVLGVGLVLLGALRSDRGEQGERDVAQAGAAERDDAAP